MKSPEKIFLIPDNRMVDDLSIIWYEAPYSTGAIEYTRTDAFIEKACEFWAKNQRGFVTYKDIADFKKYMKGE